MNVPLHDPSDLSWLAERIDAEADARQRDRYRVVELALTKRQTLEIAAIVRRPRKFVQDWVYRYRNHGRDGLTPKKQPGRASMLRPEQVESFKRRLDAGVTEADGVCTLRGREVRTILQQEFGCVYRDYAHLLEAGDAAVRTLDAERIKTLCACSWMTPRN